MYSNILDAVRRSLADLQGTYPSEVEQTFRCTGDLIHGARTDKSCPNRESLAHVYYDNGIVKAIAVGSTDCHKGQTSINDAFANISD